ncbi:MAG: flagellar hook-associated protein FlgK [Planctomycetota bacterium]|nr:MAG: flagellar hook-associated protein FlgK [Planctomycetota bacterium]
MDSFSVGLSGLDAAKKGLDIVGNNIANAATPGYHRQRVELSPAYMSEIGGILLGGGVVYEGVTRLIDSFLEGEILRQQSSLGQVSQELATLRSIESSFGELSTGSGLSKAIDEFFNAVQDLSAHPGELIWQSQAISAAEAMATQFRTSGEFLTTLESQIILEAGNTVGRINILLGEIAELNFKIKTLQIAGGEGNNLQDQRDQYITELSKLIGVQTVDREYGVVDVTIGGLPGVTGNTAMELEVGLNEAGELGVTVAGSYNYRTDLQGGQLGGLLSLKNELVYEIHEDLDDLASAIIQQINQYHVQGVGSAGSFTELTGWAMQDEDLADFDPPVVDGKIYIRVVNTSTGEITRNEVDVDVSTDTLTTLATKITAITGLSASVASSQLRIQADTNYEFDFLPAVLPEPTNSTLTGAPPTISVSGIYTGTKNQTFTYTVIGTGSVGNGTLQLEVENGDGEVVTTLNVGAGYAAGDSLDIGNGIKISLSTGDLNDSETFEVDAFGSTDTSGVLAAVGLNTFFSGDSALDMAVCSEISAEPGRVATALGADMTDNANALRMAGLEEQAISTLDGLAPGEFYRQLVTNLGQTVSVKQLQGDNVEVIIQNLAEQQGELSGVDINDEAAQMLVFEQMFQAMAKYLNTVHTAIQSIMDIM